MVKSSIKVQVFYYSYMIKQANYYGSMIKQTQRQRRHTQNRQGAKNNLLPLTDLFFKTKGSQLGNLLNKKSKGGFKHLSDIPSKVKASLFSKTAIMKLWTPIL